MATKQRNETWELMELNEEKKVIGLKWAYKTEFHLDGKIQKHKANLVGKGYSQLAEVAFDEVISSVARMETVRLLLTLAIQLNWPVFHLDVKAAFLKGDIQEEIYDEQPLGYKVENKENLVCRLRKALYGLRQAPNLDIHFLKQALREATMSILCIGRCKMRTIRY